MSNLRKLTISFSNDLWPYIGKIAKACKLLSKVSLYESNDDSDTPNIEKRIAAVKAMAGEENIQEIKLFYFSGIVKLLNEVVKILRKTKLLIKVTNFNKFMSNSKLIEKYKASNIWIEKL